MIITPSCVKAKCINLLITNEPCTSWLMVISSWDDIVTQSLMVTWRRMRTNSKKNKKICCDKLSWSIQNSPCFDCMHFGGGDCVWNRPFLRVSNLRDLDLTLNRVMRHTVVYHSSTFTYTIFHSNRKISLWADGQTYGLQTALLRRMEQST